MHVLVICKFRKDQIKNNREKVETSFSPLKVNGGFLLPWKPEFWSNLSQNLRQSFPHPSDATHKIWSRLANWLQRYSSLKVWMMTDDERQLQEDGPLVYCKLTLWAFGSGELIIYVEANVMNMYAKFPLHPPYGFWGDVFLIFLRKYTLYVAMATNQIRQFGQNSYEL